MLDQIYSPLHRGVHYKAYTFCILRQNHLPFIVWRYPLFRSVRCLKMSVFCNCPLLRDVNYSKVTVARKCPLFGDIRYLDISVAQRCPLLRGVHCLEMSVI